MRYWRYMNRMCQGWQDKPWMQLSDTCPYWIGHAKRMHQPEFVKNSLFRFYCSGIRKRLARSRYDPPKRGGSEYRHGKLYKLYWRLHARNPLSNTTTC
jgi:hypothetical protein